MEELKQRLINYAKEEGVKYTHIADKLNVHRAIISMFIRDVRPLKKSVAIALDNFLSSKNY